jgi:hypothetical protein
MSLFKRKTAKVPRKMSLVVEIDEYAGNYSMPVKDKTFIFLGEIPNLKGHVVIAGYDSGKIYAGWHIDRFRELNLDIEEIILK